MRYAARPTGRTRSPTEELYPCGSSMMKSWAQAMVAPGSSPDWWHRLHHQQVVLDRAVEQQGVLRHHTDLATQGIQLNLADVQAIDLDAPFSGS